jgi:hypothetical protein
VESTGNKASPTPSPAGIRSVRDKSSSIRGALSGLGKLFDDFSSSSRSRPVSERDLLDDNNIRK